MRTSSGRRSFWLLLALVLVAEVSQASAEDSTTFEDEDECEVVEETVDDTECPPLVYICPHPNITFHLYNGRGPSTQLKERDLWSSRDDFIAGAPLKILIHDYSGGRDDYFNRVIRDGYFRRASGGNRGETGAYNLVAVEWAALAKAPCYARAVSAVPLVGVCVAQFARALAAAPVPLRRSPAAIHMLGFGLGAHAAGRAGRCLGAQGKIGRITGLDPAGRGFEAPQVGGALSSSDALFVDVVHTGGVGRAAGHVRFLVNGGAEQPACARPGALMLSRKRLLVNTTHMAPVEAYAPKDVPTPNTAWPTDFHRAMGKALARAATRDACSHALAPVYFAEALDSVNGFWARPCPTYWIRRLLRPFRSPVPEAPPAPQPVLMGEDVPFSASGLLCVATRDHAPFALGRRAGTGVPPPSKPTVFGALPPASSTHRGASEVAPPQPRSPLSSTRSLFYDALGLVTAFFFFYLAVRYATACPQWTVKAAGRRKPRRSAMLMLKEARLARWAIQAVDGARRRLSYSRGASRPRSKTRSRARSAPRHRHSHARKRSNATPEAVGSKLHPLPPSCFPLCPSTPHAARTLEADASMYRSTTSTPPSSTSFHAPPLPATALTTATNSTTNSKTDVAEGSSLNGVEMAVSVAVGKVDKHHSPVRRAGKGASQKKTSPVSEERDAKASGKRSPRHHLGRRRLRNESPRGLLCHPGLPRRRHHRHEESAIVNDRGESDDNATATTAGDDSKTTKTPPQTTTTSLRNTLFVLFVLYSICTMLLVKYI